MKPLRNILILIPHFGQGGAERSSSKIAAALSRKYKVTLCAFTDEIPLAFDTGNAEVVYLDTELTAKQRAGRLSRWTGRRRMLKHYKKSRNIDVTVSFLEGADYLNAITRTGDRIMLSIRGSKMFDGEIAGSMGTIRKKFLIPKLYRRADLIINVAKELKWELETFFAIPKEKLTVIPNFYNIENIQKGAVAPLNEQEEQLFKNHRVILHAGRLHQQKQHVGMLNVFCNVYKQLPDAKLILMGGMGVGGKIIKKELLEILAAQNLKYVETQSLETLSKEEISESAVFFLGFQKNPFKYYRNSALFALTSSWEGFPNVLSEAMVCGCPVISTGCPTGPKEILLDNPEALFPKPLQEPVAADYGLLMPMLDGSVPDAVAIWSKEMTALLEDSARLKDLGQRAAERMLQFSEDKILGMWEDTLAGKI